ncbi:M42 family metallopeptidase [Brevibacillus sp. NPDC003359]|uniref:M42 family metallopeptidase n=1 Tax=unclassified Brevibacillus TaxID=2684853 RepID=UPI00368CF122
MNSWVKVLKELTEAAGVPGQEQEVRELMHTYLEPLTEEVLTDNLGSIIGRKTGLANGPKIMMMGHMDEVGFMVTRVMKDGFIAFQPLGGWWSQVMLAQRVNIKTRKGDIVGVIGSKPPHLLSSEERKKVVEIEWMFIDIGASSAEQAKELGIRPGDPIVPICPFTVMANDKMYMAKALDNRGGCLTAIEVMKQLQQTDHPNIVFSGATAQEEVGCRGAFTSTYMVQPDIFIALETGITFDTPGSADSPNLPDIKCGGGPTIGLFDGSLVPNRKLRDLLFDTAEEEGIPYQYAAIAGAGTDAGAAHMVGKGAPSIVIAIPARYIHSHASILHHDDVENTVKLLTALVKKLDQKTVDWLRS